MTNGPRWNNYIASARAYLTCARIARADGEAYQTIPGTRIVINESVCDPFDNPLVPPIATCPAESVLVGLSTAAIPLPTQASACFSNVTALCASIDARGRPGAIDARLQISGTFNAGLTAADVVCPPGEAVRGVISYDFCGVDGFQLLCGPVTCS